MRYARVRLRRRGTLHGVVCAAAAATSLALAGPAVAVIPPSLEEGALEEVTARGPLPFDRSGTATPVAPFTWAGTVASGLNQQSFDPADPIATCGKTPANYC